MLFKEFGDFEEFKMGCGVLTRGSFNSGVNKLLEGPKLLTLETQSPWKAMLAPISIQALAGKTNLGFCWYLMNDFAVRKFRTY